MRAKLEPRRRSGIGVPPFRGGIDADESRTKTSLSLSSLRQGYLFFFRARENLFEESGYFENRLILDCRAIFAVADEVGGLEQFLHSRCNGAETGQDHSNFIFQDPVGVIAFLRQGPRIALDDDR